MTNRPQCGACKNLNQECKKDCIFAPYFPPDKSQEFSLLQQVYSEIEVAKLLKEQEDPKIREHILKTLLYEAKARLNNPVYGSAGYVYILQQRIIKVSEQLINAKKELASYIGEEEAGLPTYIPPIRLQKQLNPSSSFPSPPILKFAPSAAVKWDQPKIDQVEINLFTAVAKLHYQGIPTVIPLRNNGPTPDLQQQKQQDFEGEADLPLDHGLNKMDHSSSQIDQSPVNHRLYINSSHIRDSTKRKREDVLVSSTPACQPQMNSTERFTSDT